MLDRYREWSRQREEQRLAKWAEIRKKGRSHFVSGYALKWSIVMTALFAVVKLFFGEPFHIASVTINLVFFFIIGLIVGLTERSSRETEYFKHHPAPEEIYNITGRDI